ncbi:hypothetical protein ACHHYP_15915 [Achlya hypogyna]|uniref:Uncharacterized protein n=1 Tax=Achlya hypogyna TaxID=1202772 RepID=A0A1V9Y9U9_ACHHY|nr:hypothetical protein ACHHYP_15915 [Achlya hypogyna]
MADEALVHNSSVYVFAYDAATQAHKPLAEGPLGLVLLAAPTSYRLMCYNSAREELLSAPLTDLHLKFTLQQDHYVNFYIGPTKNYSMRFKDDAAVQAFLLAVAAIKAHLAFTDDSMPFEDTVVGEGYAVAMGDIVGISVEAWQASDAQANPAELLQSPPVLTPTDLQKVRLGDISTECIPGISTALLGMQKGGKRFLYLQVAGNVVLASVELLKVKKEKSRPSPEPEPAQPPVEERHDDLVSRMAALSRIGSNRGALLLPQMPTQPAPLSHRSSMETPPSASESRLQPPIALSTPLSHRPSMEVQPSTSEPVAQPSTALATPLSTPTTRPTPTSEPTPELDALRREKETLLKEQAALARMRQEWEEAARQQPTQPQSQPTPAPRAPVTPPRQSAAAMYPPLSLHAPPSAAFFEPTPLLPSFAPAPAPVFTPTTATYASTPPFTPPFAAATAELDAGLQRVARSTLSMEGLLLDLQAKMDRLLNQAAHRSGSVSGYGRRAEGSYGNQSLLKGLEKVLAQNEQLERDLEAREHELQETRRRYEQLQDDLDRAHGDQQRLLQQSSTQARAASEMHSLQAALDHAKQRCQQLESDATRALGRADDERQRRLQADDEVQRLQRTMHTLQQATASASEVAAMEAKVEEARAVAIASQKKWAEEKQALVAQLAAKDEAVAALDARHADAVSAAQHEADRVRQQMLAEREAHERDAAEAIAHLNELVAAGGEGRKKQTALEAQVRDALDRADEAAATARRQQAATTDLVKVLMNDIYFACQDAFEEDGEFTGKEVATTIRKLLKQQTAAVLQKLESPQ